MSSLAHFGEAENMLQQKIENVTGADLWIKRKHNKFKYLFSV
jgi:hypothetical protein